MPDNVGPEALPWSAPPSPYTNLHLGPKRRTEAPQCTEASSSKAPQRWRVANLCANVPTLLVMGRTARRDRKDSQRYPRATDRPALLTICDHTSAAA